MVESPALMMVRTTLRKVLGAVLVASSMAGTPVDEATAPRDDVRGAGSVDVAAPARVRRVEVVPPRPAPEGYVYWKTVTAKVTAYDPSYRCCGPFADGKTATGRNAWRTDGCAVDPRAIPYGTMVYIPGVGFRVADDTGIAMKRSWRRGVYHVDVRMTYHYQARRWGVKYLKVDLYRRVK